MDHASDLGQRVTNDQGGGIRMEKEMNSQQFTIPGGSVWPVGCPAHGLRVIDLHGPEPMCSSCRVMGPDGRPLGSDDA